MRRRRVCTLGIVVRQRVVATWWLAGLVVAVAVATPAAASSSHRRALARPHSVATYVVPVRACRTKTAVEWQRGPKIPSTRRVAVPTGIARQVALYTDQYSATEVLGPRGWRCVVSYYADGGALFFIFAPDERSPGFFPDESPPRRSDRRELVVQSNPACVSCVLAQACPYFAHARHLMHEWGYWSAKATKACRVPTGERVRQLAPTLMQVVDPPHVLGYDVPSGGPYSALGEVGYFPVAHRDAPQGSYQMTCTLPGRDHALCYASLHWNARSSTSS